MKDLVEMYNDYRTKQEGSIKEVFCLNNHYDIEEFNTSVITLFDWVRLEYKRDIWIASGRRVKHKNLIIPNYGWCQTLRKIVIEEPAFSRYFEVDGVEIRFSSLLSESDRLEFCRKSAEDLVVVSQDLFGETNKTDHRLI